MNRRLFHGLGSMFKKERERERERLIITSYRVLLHGCRGRMFIPLVSNLSCAMESRETNEYTSRLFVTLLLSSVDVA